MKIRFLNQPKEVKLEEILLEKLSRNFEKVWIVAGFAKDTAIEILLPHFENAINNGSIVELIIGVDNKNISKDMLLKLLNVGCKIRVHVNKDESKLETRMYAFENAKGDSFVYLSGSKFSEGGLTENKSLVTEIIYDETEKQEFNKVKLSIENSANYEDIFVLDMNVLKTLAENGEILARITERKIPRISELYKTENISIGMQEYDESASLDIKDKINEDIDIQIDFSGSNEVKYQQSLGDEVEQKIVKKVNIPEEKEESTVKVSSKLILGEKEINYDNMNTFIMQVNKIPKSGVTYGEIKIPNYIAENMNKFFDFPDIFHVIADSKGKLKDTAIVKFKIYDNKTKKENIADDEVKIYQTEKYLAINSEVISKLDVEEGDIVRIIKEEKEKYTCEIIRKETEEYQIWESFCIEKIKGSSKKFGIM